MVLAFIGGNFATIIISAVILSIVVLIILKIRKDKKKGKAFGCGCGCENCPSSTMCHKE
jgi:hypothetical protein